MAMFQASLLNRCSSKAKLALSSPDQQPIRIVFEMDARDAAGAHRLNQICDFEGGVGVSDTLGPDVGDAVAVRIRRMGTGLPGEVRSHAVGCRKTGPLTDKNNCAIRAKRVGD